MPSIGRYKKLTGETKWIFNSKQRNYRTGFIRSYHNPYVKRVGTQVISLPVHQHHNSGPISNITQVVINSSDSEVSHLNKQSRNDINQLVLLLSCADALESGFTDCCKRYMC